MIFELLHQPLPDGYGEALLPVAVCKQHLSIDADDDEHDALVAVLRDAAVEFVEDYCALKLGERDGLEWRAEGFPAADTAPLELGVLNATAIEAVAWQDSAGAAVTGTPADFRLGLHGKVLPAIGGTGWPSGVGGGVTITFSAGFAAGDAPAPLLQAARLFLGHLWLHREAVVAEGAMGEVPMGVAALCSRWRRVLV